MKKQAKRPALVIGLVLTLVSILLVGTFISPKIVNAQADQKIVITFFWGDGCPHCAQEKPFLTQLAMQYPNIEIRAYELYQNPQNIPVFEKMANAYGFEASGVPTTFLGDSNWVGYSDSIKSQIENSVKTCLKNGCSDSASGILTPAEISQAKPWPELEQVSQTTRPTAIPTAPVGSVSPELETGVPESRNSITLPLIGVVNLQNQSLPIATLLISFVDGVNPCSIWALTMLLALTLHTGSRKKILIIGFVFISVTAAIYALFILGLFSVLSIFSFTGWIQAAVALVALFFAAVNIKDYFWYKEGISFTIADDKKPGIFQKMRKVLDAGDSFWGLVGATIVLAAGVSLVEFSCTAGFPVIWVNLLTAQQVEPLTFGLLLLLYMVIYQIDELGIFLAAVITLKSSRVEEKHGRILKLGGGMLMFALALTMLIDPQLMNSLSSSLIVFGSALAATLFVLLVHRRVLPAMGIYVGTELSSSSKTRKKH